MKKQSIFIFLMLISITAFGQIEKSKLELKSQIAPEIPLVLADSVFRIADEMPTLAMFNHIKNYEIRQDSSIREMLELIYRNIKYPPITRCTAIEGMVVIGFIIEKDGTMTNVHIRKGIGGGLDEEALRVVKLLPQFSPAMKDGKTVRYLYYVPIRFRLD